MNAAERADKAIRDVQCGTSRYSFPEFVRHLAAECDEQAKRIAELEIERGASLQLKTLRPKLADCESALLKVEAERDELRRQLEAVKDAFEDYASRETIAELLFRTATAPAQEVQS